MTFEQKVPSMESPIGYMFPFRVSQPANSEKEPALVSPFRPVGMDSDVAVIVARQELKRLNLPKTIHKSKPVFWLLVEEVKPMKTATGSIATKVSEVWPSTFRATDKAGNWYFIDGPKDIRMFAAENGKMKETFVSELPQKLASFFTYLDRRHLDVLNFHEPFSLEEDERYDDDSLVRPQDVLVAQEKYLEEWVPTLYGQNVPVKKVGKGDLLEDAFFPTSADYQMKDVWIKTPFGVCTMPVFYQMWKTFRGLCIKTQIQFAETYEHQK